MSWVAWRKLAKPKALGGLGFRDIQCFNDALLEKIAWRIIRQPNSLLARLLTSKYCRDATFLDCAPPSTASHGWRGILIGRDLIKRKAVYAIGTGSKVSFWRDNWIPALSHFKPIGPSTPQYETLLVSDFLTTNRNWDTEKLEAVVPHLKELILGIKLSKSVSEDHLIWSPSQNGEYTSKSGYHEIADDETYAPSFPGSCVQNLNWYSNIWNIKCSPKIKLFLWKIFHNAIPTGDVLQYRGIEAPRRCAHCGEDETPVHLFFDCSFAKEVWQMVQWKRNIAPLNPDLLSNVINCLKEEVLPPYGLTHGPLAPWLLWGLWKRRNQLIFENRGFSPHETFVKSVVDARDWQLAQGLTSTDSTGCRTQATRQRPPPNDAVSCFVDASWSDRFKTAGLGLVITNSDTGRTITGAHIAEFVYSPLVGEALAIRTGIEKAMEMDLQMLHIFSDSKTCVDALLRNENLLEIYGVLQDICYLSLSFTHFSISFVARTSNTRADLVSRNVLADFVLDRTLSFVPNS